jgi:SAM-dependent methyltransferase
MSLRTAKAERQVSLLRSLARAVIPYEQRQQLRTAALRFRHFGLRRYCPCCRSHLRRFKPFGLDPRPEALCPVCGSLERHRLIYLYVAQRTDLFDGNPKKMLHIAPETQLSQLFRKADGIDYLSADLFVPNAMVKMDVMDIHYPDNTFDVIYCSHVLEHVADDRKAMREFYRVLMVGGWAILQVPDPVGTATVEDPSVTSPEDRERLFGQHDHVRRYGMDYKDRLGEAGFSVLVDGFVRELDDRTTARFGLMRSEDVYLCRKETA